MIQKQDFLDNVEDILNVGIVENKPLSNIDILKSISKDDNLMNLFYLDFEVHYPFGEGSEMLFCKTQDFIYRLNMAISDWLIPMHNMSDVNEIKKTLTDLIFDHIDLYSAVSYDESDQELIEEFEDIFPSINI